MIETVLIIEDEKPNADRLKRLLKSIRPGLTVLAVLETVIASVDWLKQNPAPGLIIMDIRLGDGLSFEIFNQIEIDSQVIFTTAYDEYAVKAFKYNSVDYLLKPVEETELLAAIKKHESTITRNPDTSFSIEGLLNYIQPKDYRTRFLLPYRDGYKTVLIKDIAFFNTELGINRAYLFNGDTEPVNQTLEELEKQLDPKQFFRVNRQYIINIQSVSQIYNHFNGKLKIVLAHFPQQDVIVSREKAAQLKAWMDY